MNIFPETISEQVSQPVGVEPAGVDPVGADAGVQSTARRSLIAGIGNIFLGDDAFGCEVVRRLASRSFPDGVRIVDFGIRGLDLAYCLLEGYQTVILVDAVPRDELPGTLYLIEPDIRSLQTDEGQQQMIDAHGMHPEKVLRLAASMGATLGRVFLVGCEPTPFDPDRDVQIEL